ncbi:MAG: hypothetical protein NVSMB51_06720 [Solirubrobacteraceae bacterium]
MSKENVELVRMVYMRLADGDSEFFFSVLDPAIEWDERLQPDGGIYRGVAAVREFQRRWVAAWRDIRWEPEDFTDAGENVVVTISISGTGRSSGVSTRLRRHQVWRVRGGRVIHFRGYKERDEALKAVGLRE